jgi:hypothetical protein
MLKLTEQELDWKIKIGAGINRSTYFVLGIIYQGDLCDVLTVCYIGRN